MGARASKCFTRETSDIATKKNAPSELGRFNHPWFRQFDQPTDGYQDSAGFMNRLPLRLESRESFIHGTVDATKMWSEYADEEFVPILVGGKAVVSMWFNIFTDTDCGGAYLETWYNTFVTAKSKGPQIELPFEGPMSVMGAMAHPDALIFLQRVLCGDAPGNPGAALKAITGGREIFGFPKHPVLANIRTEEGAMSTCFDVRHLGYKAVTMKIQHPEAVEGALTLPIEATTGPDTVIGAPRLGGTHKGHNGANQMRFGQAFSCTQNIAPWNSLTDVLELGDDSHYAVPLKRWDFEPLLKVHSTDFKIAAFKPSGWVAGSAAAEAVRAHEAKMAAGTMAGAL